MKTELKKSVKKDLPIIAEIYKAEFSKSPYNEDWTDEKVLEKVTLFNNIYDLYTIKLDKKIVGFIAINPKFMCPGDVAFGEEIAIKQEFQGRGIGTSVFEKIFKIYRKKGFKKFMGIAYAGERPLSLYKRLGILPSKKGVLIEKKIK